MATAKILHSVMGGLLVGLCTACAPEEGAARQEQAANEPASRAGLAEAALGCPVWFVDETPIELREVRALTLSAQPALSFSQAARLALDHHLIALTENASWAEARSVYERVYVAEMDAAASPEAAIRALHGRAVAARASIRLASGPCRYVGGLLL